MKVIIQLWHNWMPAQSDGNEVFGEQYEFFEAGKNGVSTIVKNDLIHPGDKLCYTVYLDDGGIIELYNVNSVKYKNV